MPSYGGSRRRSPNWKPPPPVGGGGWGRGSMEPLQLVGALASLVVVNLVLSGDNAVVIGMAAHRLPPRQRRAAILIGGGAAIVLRIALTAIAALLLQVSGLQLAGGILLIWIAFRLMAEEEQSRGGV